jgi:hypothetical protein
LKLILSYSVLSNIKPCIYLDISLMAKPAEIIFLVIKHLWKCGDITKSQFQCQLLHELGNMKTVLANHPF